MDADDLRQQSTSADSVANAASERRLADKLEALQAEKVMQRALELESESLDEPHLISADQLERIAKEIGVDPAFVQQALGEVRLSPAERSRFAQWIIPDDLFETITISDLKRSELDTAISKWMRQREGLAKSKVLDDGIDWDIDRRWRAKTRARTLSGDNRISRVAGGDVMHRVHTVSETEHVVALESLGRLPLLFAKVLLAAGGALAASTIVGGLLSGDYVLGPLFGLLIAAAAAVTAVGGARWWARGIRGALSRSLLGIADFVQQGSPGLLARLRKGRRRKRSDRAD